MRVLCLFRIFVMFPAYSSYRRSRISRIWESVYFWCRLRIWKSDCSDRSRRVLISVVLIWNQKKQSSFPYGKTTRTAFVLTIWALPQRCEQFCWHRNKSGQPNNHFPIVSSHEKAEDSESDDVPSVYFYEKAKPKKWDRDSRHKKSSFVNQICDFITPSLSIKKRAQKAARSDSSEDGGIFET